MSAEREDYMRRQEADHDMIRMRQPRAIHTHAATRGPSYAEVVAQRDRAQGEADATHAQLVTMIQHVRNRETGWRLVLVAVFVAGVILGAVSYPLAVILVGSV